MIRQLQAEKLLLDVELAAAVQSAEVLRRGLVIALEEFAVYHREGLRFQDELCRALRLAG
jgi:hypothetical protein